MEEKVVYGNFEMPQKIAIEESSPTFARFIAEPFERGYGHTIGNALRRVLLSSIEAPAIISVYMQDALHEYMALDGVVEDMTNVILNFKGALLRRLPTEEIAQSSVVTLSVTIDVSEDQLAKSDGGVSVKLKDVIKDELFEVMNPDLHLFTITKPMSKKIKVKIGIGRGYVASERHVLAEKEENEIVIDSSFSPVTLVNYYVENTRVGQDTDFDKLILEITTDGRITPKEALTFAAQIAVKHFTPFVNIEAYKLSFEEKKDSQDNDKDEIFHKLSLKINEIELSVRSTNCLNSAQIYTIGELVVRPESEMLKYRNFGKKSLTEIKEKLTEMGLSLGMDLSRYNINKDNIKDVIETYEKEKRDN